MVCAEPLLYAHTTLPSNACAIGHELYSGVGCTTNTCAAPRGDAAFAKYDDAKEIQIIDLKRTSQSWDGVELPDYPVGKPELVVRRYVFPRGSKLGWHHHPVMNYGILQQGELTIIGLDGKETIVRAGEPVVEMVGTVHHGENRSDKTVVLDMFYISQPGTPIAVQHPEITK